MGRAVVGALARVRILLADESGAYLASRFLRKSRDARKTRTQLWMRRAEPVTHGSPHQEARAPC